jgi:hypothetical protein
MSSTMQQYNIAVCDCAHMYIHDQISTLAFAAYIFANPKLAAVSSARP